eukprot:7383620-Prymnesium_polylepis.1
MGLDHLDECVPFLRPRAHRLRVRLLRNPPEERVDVVPISAASKQGLQLLGKVLRDVKHAQK